MVAINRPLGDVQAGIHSRPGGPQLCYVPRHRGFKLAGRTGDPTVVELEFTLRGRTDGALATYSQSAAMGTTRGSRDVISNMNNVFRQKKVPTATVAGRRRIR